MVLLQLFLGRAAVSSFIRDNVGSLTSHPVYQGFMANANTTSLSGALSLAEDAVHKIQFEGAYHGVQFYGGSGHPQEYTLFQEEDIMDWVVFTVVFFALIFFDNFVLHRTHEALSFQVAICYTICWQLCAVAFNVYIYYRRGLDDAFMWGTGYFLEWMLSVDNLFVWHLIFNMYGTPSHLKHKPLFWGIAGAIIFRLIFFCIEEVLMHSFWWMHFVFGIFLIYTGIQAGCTDDEDSDPRNNRLFVFMQSYFRFIDGYDSHGSFFVQVRVDKDGNPILPEAKEFATISRNDSSPPTPKKDSNGNGDDPEEETEKIPIYDTEEIVRRSSVDEGEGELQWRATMLFLVVICIEITDIIFAVDSVSAIVAQVPDLYLAYTSCVFAMLGLRALFFVIDELIKLFSLLSYGVAIILIFIGVKLMIKEWVHIPPWIVCIILVSTIAISMVASIIYDKYKATDAEN